MHTLYQYKTKWNNLRWENREKKQHVHTPTNYIPLYNKWAQCKMKGKINEATSIMSQTEAYTSLYLCLSLSHAYNVHIHIYPKYSKPCQIKMRRNEVWILDKCSLPESSQLTGYQFLCYNSTAFLLFLYRSPSAVKPVDSKK